MAKAHDGAGFVDDVDGAVGQLEVAQVARCQFHRRLNRGVVVAHVVMCFVSSAQSIQNAHRLFSRRFFDGNALQPPRERAILLDLLELLVRRRTDHPKVARRQNRLDHRREIHRAARGGAGADGGVDFVDEQNGARARAEGLDDGLEALFEVAPEPRARQERARVQREHLGFLQNLRYVVGEEPRGQTLGHGRLADARVTDKDRVVLAAPAQDLDGALEFRGAPDQGVETPVSRPVGQIHAIGRERVARGGRAFVTRTCLGSRARWDVGIVGRHTRDSV